PRSARVWFALGQLCETGKRWSEAAACFRQAAEIGSGKVEAYFARKPHSGTVLIEVSAGEVLDKSRILCIKSQRLSDLTKRVGVVSKRSPTPSIHPVNSGRATGV